MSRLSVSASLEAELLEALRALVTEIPTVGLLETADEGSAKYEDLTSLQVRVYNFRQVNEAMGFFTVSAEVRLNVEQSESANGGMFFSAHEAVALWLEDIMMGDNCTALSTAEAFVDGFQRTGGDKDFDAADGVWFAVWNVTLTGRIKPTEQEATANG